LQFRARSRATKVLYQALSRERMKKNGGDEKRTRSEAVKPTKGIAFWNGKMKQGPKKTVGHNAGGEKKKNSCVRTMRRSKNILRKKKHKEGGPRSKKGVKQKERRKTSGPDISKKKSIPEWGDEGTCKKGRVSGGRWRVTERRAGQ